MFVKKRSIQRPFKHLRVFDLWPLDVTLTLTLRQGQERLCHYHVFYLGARYEVCGCNTFVLFCDLWPTPVTFSFRQGHLHFNHYMYFMFLNVCTKMKFVCSIEFEMWTIIWRKLKWRHNDVITHSIFIKLKHKSTKGKA